MALREERYPKTIRDLCMDAQKETDKIFEDETVRKEWHESAREICRIYGNTPFISEWRVQKRLPAGGSFRKLYSSKGGEFEQYLVIVTASKSVRYKTRYIDSKGRCYKIYTVMHPHQKGR